MDDAWAIEELVRFIAMTELVAPPPTPGITYLGDDRIPAGGDTIAGEAQVTEQILDRVLGGGPAGTSPRG